MASAFTTTALTCWCGAPLMRGGASNICCSFTLRPVTAEASSADPDDPVAARKREDGPEEEGEDEPGASLPFHPEPDCPRCLDTGLIRGGDSKDASCTCPAGEARDWEVLHG